MLGNAERRSTAIGAMFDDVSSDKALSPTAGEDTSGRLEVQRAPPRRAVKLDSQRTVIYADMMGFGEELVALHGQRPMPAVAPTVDFLDNDSQDAVTPAGAGESILLASLEAEETDSNSRVKVCEGLMEIAVAAQLDASSNKPQHDGAVKRARSVVCALKT